MFRQWEVRSSIYASMNQADIGISTETFNGFRNHPGYQSQDLFFDFPIDRNELVCHKMFTFFRAAPRATRVCRDIFFVVKERLKEQVQ